MQIRAVRTPVFAEGQDLPAFVAKHISRVKEDSVIVVTSKIVSLAEKRTVEAKTDAEKEKLKRGDGPAIRTKWVWLTITNGMLMANAGTDESNASGKVILLPEDSFASAAKLRRALMRQYGVKKLGVLITDSCPVPLRNGVNGRALGYAGFKGLRDYRKKTDIFGRPLRMTMVDIPDALAASAVLLMGEGDEQTPLAVITDAPIEFSGTMDPMELVIDPKLDMFEPLFRVFKS